MPAGTPPLCVTIGEPAGIGPDIVVSAWSRREEIGLPEFFVLGDADVLQRRAMSLGLRIATRPHRTGASPDDAIPVLPLSAPMTGNPRTPSAQDAPLVIEAIERGVGLVFAGEAGGVVTCPISKEALYATGFAFPGHTEFLAELSRRHTGETVLPVMMIASEALRTVPVTIHIPLKDVPSALTSDLVYRTARITARDLGRRFGIASPKLAVAGLNPHAGEGGTMGREDIEIVAPAIARLRAEGIDARGPLPADTMFHPAARAGYDAAICMYHDQALIPAKTLAFDSGVNVTLGLPFVRTSPDHGTAYAIAGSGKADPSSFIEALRMAARMADAGAGA